MPKPPRPPEPVSEGQLRHTRAWAAARAGSILKAYAETIVGAIDELLERRDDDAEPKAEPGDNARRVIELFVPSEHQEAARKLLETGEVDVYTGSALEPTRDPESCELWMPRGPTEEYGMVYLPAYGGTKSEVEEKIMDAARREGFRGTLKERLAELEWEIVPGTFHVNRTAPHE